MRKLLRKYKVLRVLLGIFLVIFFPIMFPILSTIEAIGQGFLRDYKDMLRECFIQNNWDEDNQ